MQVEYCNIVWSITESIQYYSAVPIVRLHTCSVDEKSEWLRTVVLPTFGCTLRPASAIVSPWLRTWSTSVALISSGTHICPRPLLPLPLFCLPTPPPRSLTPLPLLLLSGCWPRPIPCPSIVRHCNIVLCSGYTYVYLPVDGSWDAPSLDKVKIHLGAIYQFRTDLEKKSNGNV